MWYVEPCQHEDIRHSSFQLHPCGGLPTERWRCYSFCYRFHAWCKVGKPWAVQALPTPTSVQAHTHQEQSCPDPLTLTIWNSRFVFACARVFFTQLHACQGFYTRVIGVAYFSFYGRLSRLPEKWKSWFCFLILSLSLKSRWFASEAIDTPCYMHACHNSNNNLAAYLDLVFLSTPWLYRQKLSHSPGQRIVTMEKQSIISIMQLAIWVSLPCWSCFYTKGHGSSTPNNIPLQKKGNFRPHPTCPH